MDQEIPARPIKSKPIFGFSERGGTIGKKNEKGKR